VRKRGIDFVDMLHSGWAYFGIMLRIGRQVQRDGVD
jgi:hypothetical protein